MVYPSICENLTSDIRTRNTHEKAIFIFSKITKVKQLQQKK